MLPAMRTALITGGSKGIGRAIANNLSSDGYKIYIASRSCKDLPKNWTHIKTDFTRDGWKKSLLEIPPVHTLVNCVCPRMNVVKENPTMYTPEQIMKIFLAQTEPTLFSSSHFIPHMIEKKEGRIINISSFASRLPTPFAPAYSISKSAINSYTQSLFMYLRSHNIDITSFIIGLTKTKHVDKSGWNVVSAEKIAELCLREYNKPVVIPCFMHKLHYLTYQLKGVKRTGKEMMMMGQEICKRQEKVYQNRKVNIS